MTASTARDGDKPIAACDQEDRKISANRLCHRPYRLLAGQQRDQRESEATTFSWFSVWAPMR
jgi:hypothetical protein